MSRDSKSPLSRRRLLTFGGYLVAGWVASAVDPRSFRFRTRDANQNETNSRPPLCHLTKGTLTIHDPELFNAYVKDGNRGRKIFSSTPAARSAYNRALQQYFQDGRLILAANQSIQSSKQVVFWRLWDQKASWQTFLSEVHHHEIEKKFEDMRLTFENQTFDLAPSRALQHLSLLKMDANVSWLGPHSNIIPGT